MQEDDRTAWRNFAIPHGSDLPPLPGAETDADPVHPILAHRLWTLMDAAELDRLPAPAAKPDFSLIDELEAVEAAARAFQVAPGISLDQVLWTRSGPYWRGEVSARIAAFPLPPPPAYIVLLARGVTRRAALLGHAQPFVVNEQIEGSLETPGPFLILIACTLDPLGQAVAQRGYAQPVFSGQVLLPVSSAFERDVLTAIIAVQRTIDAHGLECTVQRPFDAAREMFCDHLELVLGRGGTASATLKIELSEDEPKRRARTDHAGTFTVTPARFSDGSFVAWLEEAISGAAASEPPVPEDRLT